MDKTDYFDKMDALVNDKQTYKELGLDPTPALQRKLSSKILTGKFPSATLATQFAAEGQPKQFWHSLIAMLQPSLHYNTV